MTVNVLVPLAKGFEETEAIAVIDMLRRAEINVVVAGLEEGPVESAHAVKVIPDALLSHVADQSFAAIVLPGGLEGTDRLSKNELVKGLLHRMKDEGKITAAICAAPTVLEQEGLLQGRRATCHFSKQPDLVSASFLEDPVVVDGNVVTSRGVGTALAFGLELVSILVGEDRAVQVAQSIHYSNSSLQSASLSEQGMMARR